MSKSLIEITRLRSTHHIDNHQIQNPLLQDLPDPLPRRADKARPPAVSSSSNMSPSSTFLPSPHPPLVAPPHGVDSTTSQHTDRTAMLKRRRIAILARERLPFRLQLRTRIMRCESRLLTTVVVIPRESHGANEAVLLVCFARPLELGEDQGADFRDLGFERFPAGAGEGGHEAVTAVVTSAFGDGVAGDGVEIEDFGGVLFGGVVLHDHGVEAARLEVVLVEGVEVGVGLLADVHPAAGFDGGVYGEGAEVDNDAGL